MEEAARRPRRRRKRGRRKGDVVISMPPEIVPSEEFSGEVREERVQDGWDLEEEMGAGEECDAGVNWTVKVV